MFCYKCGKEFGEGKFCANCGSKLDGITNEEDVVGKSRKMMRNFKKRIFTIGNISFFNVKIKYIVCAIVFMMVIAFTIINFNKIFSIKPQNVSTEVYTKAVNFMEIIDHVNSNNYETAASIQDDVYGFLKKTKETNGNTKEEHAIAYAVFEYYGSYIFSFDNKGNGNSKDLNNIKKSPKRKILANLLNKF